MFGSFNLNTFLISRQSEFSLEPKLIFKNVNRRLHFWTKLTTAPIFILFTPLRVLGIHITANWLATTGNGTWKNLLGTALSWKCLFCIFEIAPISPQSLAVISTDSISVIPPHRNVNLTRISRTRDSYDGFLQHESIQIILRLKVHFDCCATSFHSRCGQYLLHPVNRCAIIKIVLRWIGVYIPSCPILPSSNRKISYTCLNLPFLKDCYLATRGLVTFLHSWRRWLPRKKSSTSARNVTIALAANHSLRSIGICTTGTDHHLQIMEDRANIVRRGEKSIEENLVCSRTPHQPPEPGDALTVTYSYHPPAIWQGTFRYVLTFIDLRDFLSIFCCLRPKLLYWGFWSLCVMRAATVIVHSGWARRAIWKVSL